MSQIEYTSNDTSEYVTNSNPDGINKSGINPKYKYIDIGLGILVLYVIVLILTFVLCSRTTVLIVGIPAYIICVVFFFMLLKDLQIIA